MLLRKLVLSFLFSFLILFASTAIAKASCTQVGSNQTTCTGQQTVACSQPRPPAGNVERWCCDTQSDCDAAKGAVQQQINSQMATSPSTAPSWYDQTFPDWFAKVYDPSNPSEIFGERYTAAQVQWIVYGIFSMLIPGKSLVSCVFSGDIGSCITQLFGSVPTNPNLALQAQPKQSLLSMVFSSDRPISLISYTRNVTNRFTLVGEVHAQTVGFGFSQLNIIQDFWSSVRNMVYGLFVIFAIALAFMIMFRVKINPQTVITIQSAIPKLIIALIFVTFSFAIAGLMIDLMYVVIGFFSLLLANSGQFFANDPQTIFKFLTTGYVGINSTIGAPVGIAGLFVVHVIMFSTILFSTLMAQNGGLSAIITQIITLGLSGTMVSLISMLAFIILAIIEVWTFLKIMWMLIKTFAQVLLSVVFGPFQIALGVVVPNLGFSSWLKSLAASLAVFPITGILLAMSFVFLKLAGTATADAFKNISAWDLLGILPGGQLIANAELNNGWPPLLNGPRGMLGIIYLGVSLVLITLIPKTVEIIQGFITGKPFAYGTAIGEAFGPVKGIYGATGAPLVRTVQEQTTRRVVGERAQNVVNAVNQGLDWLGRKRQVT